MLSRLQQLHTDGSVCIGRRGDENNFDSRVFYNLLQIGTGIDARKGLARLCQTLLVAVTYQRKLQPRYFANCAAMLEANCSIADHGNLFRLLQGIYARNIVNGPEEHLAKNGMNLCLYIAT